MNQINCPICGNKCVKSGKTKEQITNYILNNSYSGTTALIKFKHWKKV